MDDATTIRNFVLPYVGVGIAFRGKSYRTRIERDQRVAVVTRWIILFWLPVLPLSSWLVRDLPLRVNDFDPALRNYALIRRIPLYWRQVLLVGTLTLITVVGIAVLHHWLARGE